MRCSRPRKGREFDNQYYGCGACLPCRVTKAREWTVRQMLESYTHDHSCFVTLTYADEHLPKNGSLRPEDPTLFLKSLRMRLHRDGGPKVRYFLCGEYGDRSERPHYHLSLFGLSELDAPLVQHYWQHGYTKTAEFNQHTARYLTGYVTKYRTRSGDMGPHRIPEYSRQSRRPGLGTAAIDQMADRLLGTSAGRIELLERGDVPNTIKLGNRDYPLGRQMLKKLREAVYGKNSPQAAYIKQKYADSYWDEVSEMRQDSAYDPCSFDWYNTLGLWQKKNRQYTRQVEAREKMSRHKRTI